ncbi:MAG: SHOCT domain-containing protein [Desulfovibrionaceae bacterium]
MDLNLLHFLAQPTPLVSGWEFWPFSSGTGEKWLPMLARIGFMLAILAVVAGFLRFLHGPKGILRDKELDIEAEQMRQEELAELDREYQRGDLPESIYKRRKKHIERS